MLCEYCELNEAGAERFCSNRCRNRDRAESKRFRDRLRADQWTGWDWNCCPDFHPTEAQVAYALDLIAARHYVTAWSHRV